MSENPTTSKPKLQEESTLLKQVRFIKSLTADPDLATFGKVVANALIFTFWNKDEGKARPGHARLAKEAGITKSSLKRGIDSLKARGCFIVEPSFDDQGDPGPNHYYPIWKRAEGKAPAGSEKPKKAQPNPANKIVVQVGFMGLTQAEVADIEEKVGTYAMPFFDGLRKDAIAWPKDTWRQQLDDMVAIYAEDDEVAAPAEMDDVGF